MVHITSKTFDIEKNMIINLNLIKDLKYLYFLNKELIKKINILFLPLDFLVLKYLNLKRRSIEKTFYITFLKFS